VFILLESTSGASNNEGDDDMNHEQPDYDFAIGFLLVLIAGINWLVNVYFGFTTLNPWCLWGAVASLVWFLFAPVYITRAIDLSQWTFSMWGNSIWSATMWRRAHP
jgi:membrane protein YdbS with pleckstrin-like domain